MKFGRLSRSADIDRVKRKGSSVRDSFCGFRFLSSALPYSRAGFVISTKVDKRAVVRNRLRRQYKEIVRELLSGQDASFDLLLYPTTKAIPLTYEEKKQLLKALFAKHGLVAP